MNWQDSNRIILFLMQIKSPATIVECFDGNEDRATKIIEWWGLSRKVCKFLC